MFIMEFDLAGAEWVVVAYLSGDKNMIGVVESGKSPHIVTGSLISGAPEEFVQAEHEAVGSHTDPDTVQAKRSSLNIPPGIFLPRVMSIRQAGKKSNHGLNYNMKYRRFALENEMSEADAEPIVNAYVNKAYPGLKLYWESVRLELRQNNRVLVNCFGRKVRLLKEWGEELYNQAYSFKPQSTVVDIVNDTMVKCYNNSTPAFKNMFLGAQVHDSLQVQCEEPKTEQGWHDLAVMCWDITQYMRKPITYNGKTFQLGCDAKLGYNWGDTTKFKISQSKVNTIQSIRDALVSCSQMEASAPAGSEAAVEEALEKQTQDPQLEQEQPLHPPSEEVSLEMPGF